MANKNKPYPPEWLYPLYSKEDKKIFKILVRIAKSRNKIKVIGTPKEMDEFILKLMLSLKLKKWRALVIPTITGLAKGTLNAATLLVQARKLKIKKGIDRSWAIYTQDKRLCLIIDKLAAKKVHYVGSRKDFVEFICRFLLTEFLQDWRGSKIMVALESLKRKNVSLKHLNNLLALWDFTGIFN
ncbi:MAG: hypothetical protein WCV50_02765 [Patescibacteria group bacterium]|jgi:hypothetical protein